VVVVAGVVVVVPGTAVVGMVGTIFVGYSKVLLSLKNIGVLAHTASRVS